MADFFTKRPTSKKRAVVIDLVSDQPSSSSSPSEAKIAKPKHAKHTTTNGFTQEKINKSVSNYLTRQPQGNWRQCQNSCRIAYTYVIQNWTFKEITHQIFHFSPWGMRETIGTRLSKPQVKANFNALPNEVVDKLGVTKENFDKNALTVSITNHGYQAPQPFVRFYCTECQKTFLPKLLNNPKYGNFVNLLSS